MLGLHRTEEAQHRKLPPAILRIKPPIPPGSPLPLGAPAKGKGCDWGKTRTVTELRVSSTPFVFTAAIGERLGRYKLSSTTLLSIKHSFADSEGKS